ncbi:MAG: hypothetical protein QXN57_01305 [Desulfurococcaceae archaeon]
MLKLRGVESIIGAYLAIILIVSIMLGFYTNIYNSSKSMNDQFNNNLEKMYYVNYPPVLSLSYVNESFIKLTIYPYIPVNIEEIVIRDLSGNILFDKYVNTIVTSSFSIEIPKPLDPVVLMVISKNGIVYYYVPKLDPNLSTAPDYIKNKVFIDEELVKYLASINSTETGDLANNYHDVQVLSGVGYKVLVGRVSLEKVNDLINRGPIACQGAPDLYACNIAVTTNYVSYYNAYYYSFITPYNFTSLSPNWRIENETLYIKPWSISLNVYGSGYAYVQAVKLARVRSTSPRNITFHCNVTFIRLFSNELSSTWVNIVAYVLHPSFNEVTDVITLAPPRIDSGSNTGWLNRFLLAQYPPYSLPYNSTDSTYGPLAGEYSLTINPMDYGYSEVVVAVGAEIITTGDNVYINIRFNLN